MNGIYFLTICLNPVLQKTIVLPAFKENGVNRSREYYFDVSGKGVNVTRALKTLGGDVLHLTQAGGRNRDLFLQMLEHENIEVKWVESSSEIRFCYTLFNKEKNTSTEIVEEAVPVNPGTEKYIFDTFLELLPESHTIIISGTKAAGFSDQLYPRIVQKAKEADKLIILDYRGNDLINSIKFSPDIIKPNLDEFHITFFPEYIDNKDTDRVTLKEKTIKKMISLWERYHISTVLTNGSKPVFYLDNGNVKQMKPHSIMPLNTTGCGDAFTAGFAEEYRRERNILNAVKSGLDCGRRNALTLRPGYLL